MNPSAELRASATCSGSSTPTTRKYACFQAAPAIPVERDLVLALAQEFSDRFRVVDGARPLEIVAADVRRLADEALEGSGA